MQFLSLAVCGYVGYTINYSMVIVLIEIFF